VHIGSFSRLHPELNTGRETPELLEQLAPMMRSRKIIIGVLVDVVALDSKMAAGGAYV
jgi:hypothetical protein